MIRVLRLIEYVYDNSEIADKDMSNWKLPAIGEAPLGPNQGKRIRSTTLIDLNFNGERT